MIGILDWALVAGNVLGAGAWIVYRTKGNPDRLFKWLYLALYLIHLVMGIYFFDYITQNGGDSVSYWQLPGYSEQGFAGWIAYYEYGSSFVQTVNAPFVWAGVGYLGGTALYNFLSFVGIGLIYEKTGTLFPQNKRGSSLALLFSLLVCLSPGLHFWSGGISKESLLIVALGLVYRYSDRADAKSLLLAFLGFFLALQSRVVVGLVLAIPFLVLVLANRNTSRMLRFAICGVTGLMLMHGLVFLQRALFGEDEISVQSITEVSEQQLGFLEGFGANSQINLSGMGFFERLSAILLRPFPWEAVDSHTLVYSLENAFLILVVFLGGYYLLKSKRMIPLPLLTFFVVSLMMIVIYTFTLNNYGIVYRMKSIFLPFLSLPFIWATCIGIADSRKFSV
ncbi:hypothetical protein [Algoriphagus terrigena]|uniref:hypothetical protein n=1 Tax=Algoriphagus terrigena TaxID=344884 RepID=UPI000421FD38|nr:hypothetical protein [Algoriphagus terrigena]